MACGTPALVGRTPSLLEVAGEAVEAVDPRNTVALGDALVSLARDDERRRELSRLGLQRARCFSWERAAEETLAVYRAAVESATNADRRKTSGRSPVRVDAVPAGQTVL